MRHALDSRYPDMIRLMIDGYDSTDGSVIIACRKQRQIQVGHVFSFPNPYRDRAVSECKGVVIERSTRAAFMAQCARLHVLPPAFARRCSVLYEYFRTVFD